MAALERALVLVVIAHSLVLGVAFGAMPEMAVGLGGFGAIEPLFFVRHVGVFMLILALAYWLELKLYGGVSVVVLSKICSSAFLFLSAAFADLPRVVLVAAIVDAVMAFAVAFVRAKITAARRAAAKAQH